jgi:hypothetical protein
MLFLVKTTVHIRICVYFTVGRWMQKQKKLVSLKCKRRKWAMHITAHLRYGCHFLGMALFRTV